MPLNQTQHTTISFDSYPFYVNTGAMVHLSPDQSDFLNLHPITPRSVRGVGGSATSAVGMSDIKLRIVCGTSLILWDVLYIPNVAVCLISMSILAQDSNTVAHFDNTTCWITNKSTGATIAQGLLLANQNLYSLTLCSATAEHTFAVHNMLNMVTWHHHLGHVNYQALYDMVRQGTLLGMPKQPSVKPPKCESCILGKQTRTPVLKKHEEGDIELQESWKTFG